VVREELVELSMAFVEGNNAADTVKARNKADNQRKRLHETVEDPCVVGNKPYVVANLIKNWNAELNGKVDHHVVVLLGPCLWSHSSEAMW